MAKENGRSILVPIHFPDFSVTLFQSPLPILFSQQPITSRAQGQDYQMFWPEKSEFIRMAAAFNATIVPFAAVGCADRYNQYSYIRIVR